MIPELEPDVISRIVKHAIEAEVEDDAERKGKQQRMLANLMLVSDVSTRSRMWCQKDALHAELVRLESRGGYGQKILR
jgi:hypothetical protein